MVSSQLTLSFTAGTIDTGMDMNTTSIGGLALITATSIKGGDIGIQTIGFAHKAYDIVGGTVEVVPGWNEEGSR